MLADRVKETSTTTGTGTLNLAGAVTGYQGFVAAIGNAKTCYYTIVHQSAAEWEVGIGTVTDASPDTLSRDTILASSNAGAAVNFSAGTKDIFVTIPASVKSSILAAGICEGRLTLTSGMPVTTADVTGATSIYFTPYKGNRISLYDGISEWRVHTFTEITQALGTLTSGLPYDVFAYLSGGSVVTEIVAWANGTTRATAITLQNGVYVKTGSTTKRYLGTFCTTSTTQTEDSTSKRYVWNYYNRVRRRLFCEEISYYNYTTATYREANGGSTYGTSRFGFVTGVKEDHVFACAGVTASNSGGNAFANGIGLDSGTSNVADLNGWGSGTNVYIPLRAHYDEYIAIGVHYLAMIEWSQAAGTTTWWGSNGGTGTRMSMVGSVMG